MRFLRPLLVVFALTGALPAKAAEAAYEPRLLRLSEILGSLHYLRNLCGDTGNAWRDRMEALLAAENPDPGRKARYVASFNRGYRAFAQGYTTCTDSAVTAIGRYMSEGEALSRELVARYAN